MPWQISSGATLYQDLAHFNGPLSAYLHALIFWIFGPGILKLAIFNLILATVFAWLVYRFFKENFDSSAAFFTILVFLTMFAFSHYLNTGNYNFVTPYSYELTHGLLISVGGLWLFQKYQKNKNWIFLILTGITIGLVFLTKIEVFVALSLATTGSLIAELILKRQTISETIKIAVLLLAGAAIPVAAAIAYFSFPSLLLSYRAILDGTAGGPFYQSILGLNKPTANIGNIIIFSLVYVAVAASIWALHYFLNLLLPKNDPAAKKIAVVILAVIAYFAFTNLPWGFVSQIFKPLPIFTAVASIWLIVKKRSAPLIFFSLFSFFLLLKIFFNAQIAQYGFVLTLPAVLLLTATAITALPEWLAKKFGGDASLIKMLVIILIAGITVTHFKFSERQYDWKSYKIGSGADAIFVRPDGRSLGTELALSKIEGFIDTGNFAVIPEGVMLNYLARKPNPSGFLNFMPLEISLFGEEKMIAALEKSRPDYVILIDKNLTEDGCVSFGKDCGRKIMEWVKNNYAPLETIGAEPFQGKFGIVIAKRQ